MCTSRPKRSKRWGPERPALEGLEERTLPDASGLPATAVDFLRTPTGQVFLGELTGRSQNGSISDNMLAQAEAALGLSPLPPGPPTPGSLTSLAVPRELPDHAVDRLDRVGRGDRLPNRRGACKESCVRNAGWVYPSTTLPYVEVSPALVGEITADLDAEVTAWRQRRLDAVWPIVYLDGIVVHVRGDNGRVSQHTMYGTLGVNLLGKKELLGLGLSATEGAKFWLSCLTDLKDHGLNDIFIACADGLTGFPEAIRTANPFTIETSIFAHLVAASLHGETGARDKQDRLLAEAKSDVQTLERLATVSEHRLLGFGLLSANRR